MSRRIAFSAVLLAGGRSSRMGRDKAEIALPDGRPLWRRQLDDVLRPLGPAEIFLSGPARAGLPADVRVLADARPGLGPLSGIEAALGAASAPLVVVLAVDLPAMTAGFLRSRLLSSCTPRLGAVPQAGNDRFYEPLAAAYPRACLALAAAQLGGADHSLQTFVRAARAAGLVGTTKIGAEERRLFENWNLPGHLPDSGSP